MALNQFNSIQLNKQLGRSCEYKVDRPRLASTRAWWSDHSPGTSYLFYVGVKIIKLLHKLVNRLIPSYHSSSRSMTSDWCQRDSGLIINFHLLLAPVRDLVKWQYIISLCGNVSISWRLWLKNDKKWNRNFQNPFIFYNLRLWKM